MNPARYEKKDSQRIGLLSYLLRIANQLGEDSGNPAKVLAAVLETPLDECIRDILSLLRFLHILNTCGSLLRKGQSRSGEVTDDLRHMVYLSYVSEYCIDDLDLLPHSLREKRLCSLASTVNIDVEDVRQYVLGWHSSYRELLCEPDYETDTD